MGRAASTDTGVSSSLEIPVPVETDTTIPVNNIASTEVDDPRVAGDKDNWKPRALGAGNTFGAVNSCSTLGTSPTLSGPQQDTDASGHISAAGLYMPPPKGAANIYTRPDGTVDDNTLGVMTSVAELGFLPTGNESTTLGGQAGTPWRTLRLQPSTEGATVVPDWALMGLFAVPTVVPSAAQSIFTPHNSSIGGRLNINALCQPFSFLRTYPLAGVFQGAQNLMGTPTSIVSASTAQTLASNIASMYLRPTAKTTAFQTAIIFREKLPR